MPAPIRRSVLFRVYLKNHSYPELREISTHRELHRTWFRALLTAWRDTPVLVFLAIQIVLNVLGPVILVMMVHRWSLGSGSSGQFVLALPLAVIPMFASVLVALTWGGDLMRPHLRRASETARQSCPECGFLLGAHRRQALETNEQSVACPECATRVPLVVFEPPYPIPKACRAVRLGRGSERIE